MTTAVAPPRCARSTSPTNGHSPLHREARHRRRSSGRTVEFDVDSSGDLVNVIPARHVGACAPAPTPSGCIGYAYDSNHNLTRVFDPRYDGSNTDYTDIAYAKIGYAGDTPTATAITPAATGAPLLRVFTANQRGRPL